MKIKSKHAIKSNAAIELKINNNEAYTISTHRSSTIKGCILYFAVDRFLNNIAPGPACTADISKFNHFFDAAILKVKK